MYIISWGMGSYELVGSHRSIIEMAQLLESTKVPFTISTRCGKVSQLTFGCGDFKYWKED